MLQYAVAMWFGFALALYLLPLMETGSDFCRRGVHCDLLPSPHQPAALVESVQGPESTDAASETAGQRGRPLALLRITCLRGLFSHSCRSMN